MIFGVPLQDIKERDKVLVPPVIEQIIRVIRKDGNNQPRPIAS